MDFLKNAVGGDNNNTNQNQNEQSNAGGEPKKEGGFLSGIGDKINGAAGGGKEVRYDLNQRLLLSFALTIHTEREERGLPRQGHRLRSGEVLGCWSSGQ